jgi:hypothetical protein
LAIDRGTRLEEEEMDDGNDNDCAVGMQRGQAHRLHNIQDVRTGIQDKD